MGRTDGIILRHESTKECISMDFLLHPSTVLAATHGLIVVAIAIRVIMRRPDTGVALAWLLMVAVLPFGGAVVYFLIGERRISHRRARGIATLRNAKTSVLMEFYIWNEGGSADEVLEAVIPLL
ncbi:MAG: hypothetical protein E2O40_01535 [Planctomycetota bacterium]|nr:MAG: hypothetical protein E2O40_01535 [Planctomycetota bacterium]